MAVGPDALFSNTTGMYNIGIGDGARFQVTNGSYNTAVGAGALGSGNRSVNTAIGNTLEAL